MILMIYSFLLIRFELGLKSIKKKHLKYSAVYFDISQDFSIIQIFRS